MESVINHVHGYQTVYATVAATFGGSDVFLTTTESGQRFANDIYDKFASSGPRVGNGTETVVTAQPEYVKPVVATVMSHDEFYARDTLKYSVFEEENATYPGNNTSTTFLDADTFTYTHNSHTYGIGGDHASSSPWHRFNVNSTQVLLWMIPSLGLIALINLFLCMFKRLHSMQQEKNRLATILDLIRVWDLDLAGKSEKTNELNEQLHWQQHLQDVEHQTLEAARDEQLDQSTAENCKLRGDIAEQNKAVETAAAEKAEVDKRLQEASTKVQELERQLQEENGGYRQAQQEMVNGHKDEMQRQADKHKKALEAATESFRAQLADVLASNDDQRLERESAGELEHQIPMLRAQVAQLEGEKESLQDDLNIVNFHLEKLEHANVERESADEQFDIDTGIIVAEQIARGEAEMARSRAEQKLEIMVKSNIDRDDKLRIAIGASIVDHPSRLRLASLLPPKVGNDNASDTYLQTPETGAWSVPVKHAAPAFRFSLRLSKYAWDRTDYNIAGTAICATLKRNLDSLRPKPAPPPVVLTGIEDYYDPDVDPGTTRRPLPLPNEVKLDPLEEGLPPNPELDQPVRFTINPLAVAFVPIGPAFATTGNRNGDEEDLRDQENPHDGQDDDVEPEVVTNSPAEPPMPEETDSAEPGQHESKEPTVKECGDVKSAVQASKTPPAAGLIESRCAPEPSTGPKSSKQPKKGPAPSTAHTPASKKPETPPNAPSGPRRWRRRQRIGMDNAAAPPTPPTTLPPPAVPEPRTSGPNTTPPSAAVAPAWNPDAPELPAGLSWQGYRNPVMDEAFCRAALSLAPGDRIEVAKARALSLEWARRFPDRAVDLANFYGGDDQGVRRMLDLQRKEARNAVERRGRSGGRRM